MTERPILFGAPMVRALLAGQKTQTRRIMKEQPQRGTWPFPPMSPAEHAQVATRCPYGQPGDRLWVRESLGYDAEYGHYFAADHTFLCGLFDDEKAQTGYSYDGNGPAPRSVPSIHLPRRYSRSTLEITGVRVERLQAISDDDARAEGVAEWARGALSPQGQQELSRQEGFELLWSSINGRESWAANPWVWVVEFRRLEAAC